jgi:cyclopropane fatty-acyl-phospholipid synthase-like methyltransferase
MKIYTVTFNDGGWHTSRPEYQVVAESKEEAIEKVLEKNPHYRTGYDKWASEFKIEGYVIEVYDEKTYNREKNLENLDI